MANDISVWVFKRTGRKYFEAQWIDPVTGRRKTQSTGKINRRDADRVAGLLADEIKNGRFIDPAKVTWQQFREKYEEECIPARAKKTGDKICAVFNAVERIIDPQRLMALNASQISRFQQQLRADGLAEPTIKSHLSYLKSCMRWALRVGMLPAAPAIEMPERVKGAKGRPIVTEEFERMLASVPTIVTSASVKSLTKDERAEKVKRDATVIESWRHLLTGLWWSGLRLGEALELHWTDDRRLCVDFTGKRPMFRIQAEAEKGNKHRVLPMAPEFAEFLSLTPEHERNGFVFNPALLRGEGRPRLDWVSKVICRIGKAAAVKVAEKNHRRSDLRGKNGVKKRKSEHADEPAVKWASAHDLRRAFGLRWAMRVRAPILQQLMRHESITTTLEYYVCQDAEATAEVLWAAVSGSSSALSF